MEYVASLAFAKEKDQQDPLNKFRDQFYFPQRNGKDAIYLCGNSLGLQSKNVKSAIEQELADWQQCAVEGYWEAKNPWLYYQQYCSKPLTAILGASQQELTVMSIAEAATAAFPRWDVDAKRARLLTNGVRLEMPDGEIQRGRVAGDSRGDRHARAVQGERCRPSSCDADTGTEQHIRDEVMGRGDARSADVTGDDVGRYANFPAEASLQHRSGGEDGAFGCIHLAQAQAQAAKPARSGGDRAVQCPAKSRLGIQESVQDREMMRAVQRAGLNACSGPRQRSREVERLPRKLWRLPLAPRE